MNPEREILNFWYNRQGYLILNNLKAGHNKELYLVAVKLADGKAVECIHVEAQISVSASSGLMQERGSVESEVQKFSRKKFDDKPIKEVISKLLHTYGLESHKKVFVHGAMPANRKKKLASAFSDSGVDVVDFSEVLNSAVGALDGQTYQNHTVRTLQLIKFLLISEPDSASILLNTQMHAHSREKFLRNFLSTEQNKKILAKNSFDAILESSIKKSSLIKPDKLAELLSENLTKKSYNKLIQELHSRHPVPKKRKRKERLLSSFLGK